MSDLEPLPPHAQAVKDRATEIYSELADWLETGFHAEGDTRAAAVATLKMGVNLHIEVMGRKAAMALLAGMFREGA